jgi:hypothetical protein
MCGCRRCAELALACVPERGASAPSRTPMRVPRRVTNSAGRVRSRALQSRRRAASQCAKRTRSRAVPTGTVRVLRAPLPVTVTSAPGRSRSGAVESAQFGQAQPRAVEQLHDGVDRAPAPSPAGCEVEQLCGLVDVQRRSAVVRGATSARTTPSAGFARRAAPALDAVVRRSRGRRTGSAAGCDRRGRGGAARRRRGELRAASTSCGVGRCRRSASTLREQLQGRGGRRRGCVPTRGACRFEVGEPASRRHARAVSPRAAIQCGRGASAAAGAAARRRRAPRTACPSRRGSAATSLEPSAMHRRVGVRVRYR